eukprot:TRINITY_DN4468_c0_g1_i3.p1 TRINITY_DN4468_c0_g1~~TRINITY_DN4468_c0_g1_i3.p1  ORF type:complete len:118 (+),score=3.71 TRINITY_DN4468_c0_g1_i3:156-509(+)
MKRQMPDHRRPTCVNLSPKSHVSQTDLKPMHMHRRHSTASHRLDEVATLNLENLPAKASENSTTINERVAVLITRKLIKTLRMSRQRAARSDCRIAERDAHVRVEPRMHPALSMLTS